MAFGISLGNFRATYLAALCCIGYVADSLFSP